VSTRALTCSDVGLSPTISHRRADALTDNIALMKKPVIQRLGFALLCAAFFPAASTLSAAQSFRPPAVPLVACDPYFSIWSPADKLTDADTVHWTGKPHRLASLVRIDGKVFRLMGKTPENAPPSSKQTCRSCRHARSTLSKAPASSSSAPSLPPLCPMTSTFFPVLSRI